MTWVISNAGGGGAGPCGPTTITTIKNTKGKRPMGTELVDPFAKEPKEVIFQASAEFEDISRRYHQNNTIIAGDTFTEQLQHNFIRPTFWERVQILIFGVSPYKILKPRPVSGAELIVASLESEPSKWSQKDKYHVTHKNGITIWVANDDYGIRYVNTGGAVSHFTHKEKKMIWEAYLDWQAINGLKIMNVWDQNVLKYAKARRLTGK